MRSLVLVILVAVLTAAAQAEEELNDPTRPYQGAIDADAYRQQLLQGYQLTSLLVSDSRKLATINGRRYRVGDQFDGARLVTIDHQGVVLDVGGLQLRIDLRQDIPMRVKQ